MPLIDEHPSITRPIPPVQYYRCWACNVPLPPQGPCPCRLLAGLAWGRRCTTRVLLRLLQWVGGTVGLTRQGRG
jgi:hypothetical protein